MATKKATVTTEEITPKEGAEGITVKTISVTFGRKINTGNYSSADYTISLWADIEPEQSLHEATQALWQMAKENVRVQTEGLRKGEKIDPNLTFTGLSTDSNDWDRHQAELARIVREAQELEIKANTVANGVQEKSAAKAAASIGRVASKIEEHAGRNLGSDASDLDTLRTKLEEMEGRMNDAYTEGYEDGASDVHTEYEEGMTAAGARAEAHMDAES